MRFGGASYGASISTATARFNSRIPTSAMFSMAHRRKIFESNSPSSSSSLEKLMLEGDPVESSSSSSRSSSSALDSEPGKDSVARSWSFEQGEGINHRRRHSSPKSKHHDSFHEQRDVGGCVAGCAADCTALCCCPLTLVHILAVLCVRFPASVAGRIVKAWKNSRRKHVKRRSADSILSSTTNSPTVSCRQPGSAVSAVGSSYPVTPSPPAPLPRSIQQGFGFGGHHLWREFDSGHSSFASP